MKETVVSTEQVRLIQFAEKIVSPLVREGVFEDFERALQSLLLDYVDRHIAIYKDKNAVFEERYKQNFESFTVSLHGQATPEQEDEWMDWEITFVFLKKWQSIREQVIKNVAAG